MTAGPARTTFPGWRRPGLIEARLHVGLSREQGRHFRGGDAPASLKRRQGAGHRRDRQDFRGGDAPASLKPESMQTDIDEKLAISGVETPRPH